MLSCSKFIRQSLELHLFFARIMKEHSFFLEIGFTPKNSNHIAIANTFRMEFDKLLAEVIVLSNGVVSNKVLQSGEVVTPFTIKAEQASSFFTGVKIPTNITKAEEGLEGSCSIKNSKKSLEERVCRLNNKAMELTKGLIEFKSRLLSDVLSCRIFTVNYPLLIDHILREAKFYFRLVQRLQNREEIDLEREAYRQEAFWNRIMAEHSKFIRGLLDPTENELINTANDFGCEFDELTREAIKAMDKCIPICKVTNDSFKATVAISEFKAQATTFIKNI